jgi:HEAT repeat protein
MGSPKPFRLLLLGALCVSLLVFASRSGALDAVFEIFRGHNIPVQGAPVAATHAKLSEHMIEFIQGLPPQGQAEELMQQAINHTSGATSLIMEKARGWHGQVKRTKKWEMLYAVAMDSNDLRVRAAAMEIDLVVVSMEKDAATVERLITESQETPGKRAYNAYFLGVLANRGVETERVHGILKEWIHDSDQGVRLWATEGLGLLGTDDTIPDLLDVLRNDPSDQVRERGGCNLAQSGMMTRDQRMKAVPGLMDIVADPATASLTRTWAFQALREITDENLGTDPAAWRNWYDKHGQERTQQFQKGDQNQIIN